MVLWLEHERCFGEERIVCSQSILIGVRMLVSWSNPSIVPMTAIDHGMAGTDGSTDPWEQVDCSTWLQPEG